MSGLELFLTFVGAKEECRDRDKAYETLPQCKSTLIDCFSSALVCLHVPSCAFMCLPSIAQRLLQSVFCSCGLGPAVEVKPDQGPSDFCKQKARLSRNAEIGSLLTSII